MAMKDFSQLADQLAIDRAIESLKANGIEAKFVQTSDEAKKEVLNLIPEKAEVMTMTSVTLDSTGIADEINNSDKFSPMRNKLNTMDRITQGSEMQKLGAAPDWVVGSVHAVTESGNVLVASNTGSQLPAYAYGSANVIWVVGTQKIVKDTEEALKRIYEYVLPLEAERAKKAYGALGSNVSKLLIINKEVKAGRITLIFVNQALGF